MSGLPGTRVGRTSSVFALLIGLLVLGLPVTATADPDTTPPIVTILDEVPFTNTPNARAIDRDGWNVGIRQIAFGATDPQSGIWRAEVELGGAALVYRPWSDFDFGCGDVFSGPVSPCPVTVPVDEGDTRSVLTFDPVQSYLMIQGLNVVKAHVWNGDQLVGDAPPLFFKVDTQKPNPPSALHAINARDSGWLTTADADLRWLNTAETVPTATKSGLVSAQIDVQPTAPGQADPPAIERFAVAIDAADDIELPADGKWRISVLTKDGAGNQSQRSDLYIDRDTVPPTGSIAPIDREKPTMIKASASDFGSGAKTAWLEYAPGGSGQWTQFGAVETADPAAASGPLAVSAQFPETSLPAGSYDLRLVTTDVAGNVASSDRWDGGGVATVQAPLRDKPTVSAQLRSNARGRGVSANRIVVPYGVGARISGSLVSGSGSPLAGTTLHLVDKALGTAFGTAVTDGAGRISARVPAGPTREIIVLLRASQKYIQATHTVRIVTTGRVDFAKLPKRVRSGRQFKLSGRVFNAGRPIKIPKTVVIQLRAGRSWRDLFSFKVDGAGRFSQPFVFGRPGVKVRVRAVVPAEPLWPFLRAESREREISIVR